MTKQNLNVSGIYCIRNLISGKVYVGSSQNIRKRFLAHKSALQLGRHHSEVLQRSWIKNGCDAFSFEILEIVEDLSHIIQREQHWIDALKAHKSDGGYNICPIAGRTSGIKLSSKTRAALSAAKRGRTKTAEHRAKIGAANTGKKRSPEFCEKMRSINLGRKMTREQRDNMRDAHLGKVNPNRCLSYADASEIRRLRASGRTISSICEQYVVPRGVVRAILDGRTYQSPEQ